MHEFDYFETDLLFEQLSSNDFKEEEIVIERAALNGDGFSLHSTPRDQYNLGEENGYFKWVDNVEFRAASHIARIKYKYPEYVIHKDPNGKKHHTLNASEKRKLIKILTNKIPQNKLFKIPDELMQYITTGWEYMIYEYDVSLGFNTEIILNHLDINEPISSLPKNFIRITLPMPNYLLLKEK